jgi:hypothetical protein
MRAFSSAALREEQLSAFYGSDEWRDNHRNSVLALIESYHTVVIELTPSTAQRCSTPARAWPTLDWRGLIRRAPQSAETRAPLGFRGARSLT